MFFRHYVYAKIKLRKGILKTLHKLKQKNLNEIVHYVSFFL